MSQSSSDEPPQIDYNDQLYWTEAEVLWRERAIQAEAEVERLRALLLSREGDSQ